MTNENLKGAKKVRILPLMAAVLIAATQYSWAVWYYGDLYRQSTLLSISQLSTKNLPIALTQHLLVNLPGILLLIGCFLTWKRQTPKQLGFAIQTKSSKITVALGAVTVMGISTFVLLSSKVPTVQSIYGLIYYLFFIAFLEELTFRAVLPKLIHCCNLPVWCVWVLPATLFAAMHTVMPVITGDIYAVLNTVTSGLIGYMVGGCIYYALYRWSGTLWLPVLIHGILDYLGAII